MSGAEFVILGGGPTALACALHAACEREVKVLHTGRSHSVKRGWVEAVPLPVMANLIEFGIHPHDVGVFEVMDRRWLAWEGDVVRQENMPGAAHVERPALERALLERCARHPRIELCSRDAAKAREEALWLRQRGATLVDASGRGAALATRWTRHAQPWVARLFDVPLSESRVAAPFMLAAMPQGYVYRVQGRRHCTVGAVGRGSWLSGGAASVRDRLARSGAAWLVEDIPGPWTALGAKAASLQWATSDVAALIGDAGLARDPLSSQGLAGGFKDARYAAVTRTEEEREALAERTRRARVAHAEALARMIGTCRWQRRPVWSEYGRFLESVSSRGSQSPTTSEGEDIDGRFNDRPRSHSPAIGFARIGSSTAEGKDGFFVGPEVPEQPALGLGEYKDKSGALKRQAARFRIFGYDAEGRVVGELDATNAVIEWTAHLANKKAAWYEFQLALDIPEASRADAPPSRIRNAPVKGEERKSLVIDPGPRSIGGLDTAGAAYRFDGGKFFHLPVPLGELRTDEAGRLLVLGGHGLSQSAVGQPPADFANNDGWHDDVSDGPVDATVKIGDKEIPVDGAWVIVGPPNYAPALKTVRTLHDLLLERMVSWGLLKAPAEVSFQKHIRPIFERLSGLQWVNQGFASLFGAGAPMDAGRLRVRLADNNAANTEFRAWINEQFRNPGVDRLGKTLWPGLYGDALDSFVSARGPKPDLSVLVPAGLASLTRLQLAWLQRWSEGKFKNDLDLDAKHPTVLDDVALADRPSALDEAALAHCLADAFHPGCEVTWIMRNRALYSSAFRIRRRPPGTPEREFGDVLTPAVALSPMGPLNGATAGDLTKWMAVPWQTDTASCLSGYAFFRTSESLPTFWPARVPNDVLREVEYQLLMDKDADPAQRIAAFQTRKDWFRVFDGNGMDDIAKMITAFDKLGIVEEREGPGDLSEVPSSVWVESKPGLVDPEALPTATKSDADKARAEVMQAPRARFKLRKFGRNR